MNLSATTDFVSLCVKYIYIALFSNHLLQNSLPLSTHILFGLYHLDLRYVYDVFDRTWRFDSSKNVWKTLEILSFKGTIYAYFLKISIIHNKKRIPLLNLLINCISARSVPQILSIKVGCTSLSLNFQIICLCNSSANCLL